MSGRIAQLLFAALALGFASGAQAQAVDQYVGTTSVGGASVSYSLLFNSGFTGAAGAADLQSGSTFTFNDPNAPVTFTYDQATNGTTAANGTSPGYVFYSQGVSVQNGVVTFDFDNTNDVFGVADRNTGAYYFCAGNLVTCGASQSAYQGVYIASPNTAGQGMISGVQTIAAQGPEPVGWLLLIGGFAGTGAVLRTSRRRAQGSLTHA